MRKTTCFLGALLMLAACASPKESKPSDVLVFNDFEMLDGWEGVASTSLNKERAHSGKYSVKVDQDNEYGLQFHQILGELTSRKPKKVKLEAWVYVPGKTTGLASIVIAVNDTTKKNEGKFWDGINLSKEATRFRDWVKVEKEFKLPDNIEPGNKLTIYLWRTGATKPVYMDDVKLSMVE